MESTETGISVYIGSDSGLIHWSKTVDELFNRKLGKRIDSKVMLATAADAVGDVITTSATVISLLFFYLQESILTVVIGVCVSLVVIWRDWNRKGYIEAASGRAYFFCRL